MQAVILAAGLGSRMGELTKGTPKPLLKIQDRTLLEHNLTALPDKISEVILVVGYLEGQIRSFIGDKFLGKNIVYVQQKELLGTAHALSLCRDVLSGRFLVIMGDDLYYRKDLEELISRPSGVLAWEMRNDDMKDSRQAIMKTNGHGELLDIVERQPAAKGTLVNCGAYVLDLRYFGYPLTRAGNQTEEFGLPQTMMQMVKGGAKFDVVRAQWWHKVASAEDLELRNGKQG